MPQHIDMPVHQWGQPGDIFNPDFFSITAYPAQGFLHIKCVPQYHCVSDQAQCPQLIFLTFTIALSGEPAEFGKNRTLRFSGHP